jgi:hypothetical protein
MAFLGQTFDVNELPQSSNFDPLPPGWYTATITKADLRPTKDGSGEYIHVQYDITGPTHQGRVVFGNLNIKNASAKAEEIGRQQLGELMRSIGLSRVTDTDQLLGGMLQIKLDIRPATDRYEAQNEVKGFKAIGGNAPPSFAANSAPAKAAPSAPAAPAKAAPPWAKK